MSDTPGWSAPDGSVPGPPPPPGYGPPPPGYGPPPPAFGSYGYPQFVEAPKPGVVPLRPLGVGELLDGAFTAVRTNWKVMLGVAAIVSAITGLLRLAFILLLRDSTGPTFTFDTTGSSSTYATTSATANLGTLVGGIVQWAGFVLIGGIASVVVSRAVLGQRTTFAQAWTQVSPRLPRLLGLTLLTGLIVLVGFVLCIIPGLYLAIALSLAAPVVVLERSKVGQAITRSQALIKGAWWRTFGIALLGYLIIAVITFAVAIPFLILGLSSSGIFSGNVDSGNFVSLEISSALASVISGTITYPFVSALVTLVYIDRRMRTEGLDIELMRAAGYGQPAA